MGPSLAGVLFDAYGFENATYYVLGTQIVVVIIIYLIFWHVYLIIENILLVHCDGDVHANFSPKTDQVPSGGESDRLRLGREQQPVAAGCRKPKTQTSAGGERVGPTEELRRRHNSASQIH